ncbi:hypothetical protein QLH51_03180 [Sphingomonas sp. 2R-10]|uniref:hypothetical protein n=1 Tax=Sphingomonas sp. 2R-10 TaxID=3045148 RepID=UPI000F76AC27|nr:hypothetical protein [Sphingomonas sp. 2R-10]MDJ0275809.1 hypothetical protein [Sphingomonas sp. 2R-10]
MVSKTYSSGRDDWSGPTIDHATFAANLARRRAALGNPELPRNAGGNRTDSKRALLAAIEAAGGRW